MKLTNTHILIISATALLAVVGTVAGFSFLALAGMAGYAFWLFHRKQELANRQWEADIKYREREAAFCAVPSKHGILSYNSGLVEFWTRQERTAPEARQVSAPEPEAMQSEKQVTALDVGRIYDRVVMAGSTRSGKSFASKQIAYQKLQEGHMVIVLDPKPIRKSDTWPDGCLLFGCNDNYPDMWNGLNFIEAERNRRASDFDNIENYPKLTIFWDEFANCLLDCPDFQPEYMKILTKYAEFGIDLFIITQSDDYESCGLPKAQYKRNFRAVLFFVYDEFSGVRQVFFNDNLKYPTEPKTAKELPPFRPVNFTQCNHVSGQPESRFQRTSYTDTYYHAEPEKPAENHRYIEFMPCNEPLHDTAEPSDEIHALIVRMYRNNESMNNIARAVFGSIGGNQNKKIKAVLAMYGLI
jgi:hypothetical protein